MSFFDHVRAWWARFRGESFFVRGDGRVAWAKASKPGHVTTISLDQYRRVERESRLRKAKQTRWS